MRRRRCAWRSPASKSATGSIPTGESRDVAVRLHPDDRVDASNIEHLPVAVAGSNMMVPLEQIATITHGQGPGADPAPGRQAHGHRVGERAGRRCGRSHAGRDEDREAIDFPAGYGVALGGASRDQKEFFSEMFIALIMGIGVMYLVLVMQFGSFTAPLP